MDVRQQDRAFDRGSVMLSAPRGAPRLHWDWNPIHAVQNVGSTIKKAVVDTGHEIGRAQNKDWVKALEAAGLAATGVGAPAAAAILGGASMLGGAIAPGGNLGTAAGQGVKGAAIGAAGAGIGNGIRSVAANGLPSIGSLASSAGGYLKDHAGQVLGAGEAALGGGLPGLPGMGGGSGGLNPGIAAMAGLQVANAANLGAKQNDFTDRAWNLANDSYTSRAGLRSAGINGLLSPQQHDLSSLTALRQQNPVAARAGLPMRTV